MNLLYSCIYSQIEHMYTKTGDYLRKRETAVRDAMNRCGRTILLMTNVHNQFTYIIYDVKIQGQDRMQLCMKCTSVYKTVRCTNHTLHHCSSF